MVNFDYVLENGAIPIINKHVALQILKHMLTIYYKLLLLLFNKYILKTLLHLLKRYKWLEETAIVFQRQYIVIIFC